MRTRCSSVTALPGVISSAERSVISSGEVGALVMSVLQTAVERLALVEEGPDAVVEHRESRADGHVHVEVLVGAQAPAEEDPLLRGLLLRQLPVALELRPVDRKSVV